MTHRRWLGAILVLALMFLLAPLLVVLLASFSDGAVMSFPPRSFTTHWYGEIKPAFYQAIWTSFVVATSAAAFSVIVGVPAALALCRGRFPGRELLGALCLSPLMVPALVTGVALYQCSLFLWDFTHITLGGTLAGIVLGHLTFGIPFVVRAVVAGHARFDLALEEAAQNLGAPPLKTFRLITLPLLRPAIVSGAVLAFAMSFDDVPIALFMGGGDATTLPVRIYTTIQYDLSGDVMAVASLVVAVSLVLIVLLNRLVGSDLFFSAKQ
jgi:putative spermidine/putrescine transport system permease protein